MPGIDDDSVFWSEIRCIPALEDLLRRVRGTGAERAVLEWVHAWVRLRYERYNVSLRALEVNRAPSDLMQQVVDMLLNKAGKAAAQASGIVERHQHPSTDGMCFRFVMPVLLHEPHVSLLGDDMSAEVPATRHPMRTSDSETSSVEDWQSGVDAFIAEARRRRGRA